MIFIKITPKIAFFPHQNLDFDLGWKGTFDRAEAAFCKAAHVAAACLGGYASTSFISC